LVESRDTGDHDGTETTSGSGGCLDNVVLTRTERSTEKREVLRKCLGKRLENSETDNGTEKRGTESPSSLETEVDVGSVNKSTTDTSDQHGAESDNPVALVGKIVVWCEGVGDSTLVVVGVLFGLDQVGVLLIVLLVRVDGESLLVLFTMDINGAANWLW
jgi:hypothetical protein